MEMTQDPSLPSGGMSLEEWQHQMTLQGIADIDAGRVISQEAAERWAASLSDPAGPLPLPNLDDQNL
jgi:hypothetical protein